jgi:hypothetical protein
MTALAAYLSTLMLILPTFAQPHVPGYVTLSQARRITARHYNRKTVRHVVTFKFKRNVDRAQIEGIKDRFLELKRACLRNGHPYIRSVEAGYANSPERLDQGKQIGFIVTFDSEGDRNYYVGQPLINPSHSDYFDPEHKSFKDFVGQYLDFGPDGKDIAHGVFVFDFSVSPLTR